MELQENSCLICGGAAGGYHLCKDCYYKYKDQRIKVEVDVGPDMRGKLIEEAEEREPKKCLLCNNDSGKYLFCKDCYPRYLNRTLLLKVTVNRNQKIDLLDESYEGIYECDDGHIVKSTIEQTIDNWLFENGIKHGYEVPLDIGKENPIRPDFYLKDYFGDGKDLYIEYFGRKGDSEYDEKTAYKMKAYKEKKISLLCLYPNRDSKNIKFVLKKRLKTEKLKENEINYEE